MLYFYIIKMKWIQKAYSFNKCTYLVQFIYRMLASILHKLPSTEVLYVSNILKIASISWRDWSIFLGHLGIYQSNI